MIVLDDELKFYIKLYVNKVEKNYNGKIVDTHNGKVLELDRLSSTLSTEEREAFKYAKIPHVIASANNGKEYVFYNLSWLGTRTHYGESNIVMHFRMSFDTLVENPTKTNMYNEVSFSFDFIEDMFGRTTFKTQFPTEDNNDELVLSVTVPENEICELADKTVIKVTTDFDGLVSSHHLFDIDIKQRKRIHVRFPDGKSLEEISNLIEIIKLYFEFVYNYRLGFNKIKLINIDIPKGYHLAELLISDLYNTMKPESLIKFKSRYTGTNTELVARIKNWIELYDLYSESIQLWKKTIYNDNIDETDRFIWICQAFESLCQHDEEIYSVALEHAKRKSKKKSYPNLSDYLYTVQDIIGFSSTSQNKHYRDIVRVRDKFIHNNPKKTISELQCENSYKLIDYFYLSLVVKKLDDIKVGRMLMLR
jgi:hypothetical protein